MRIQNIKEIAEDRLMSDLCLKWYLLDIKETHLESDEKEKQEVYEQIIQLYNKINGYTI